MERNDRFRAPDHSRMRWWKERLFGARLRRLIGLAVIFLTAIVAIVVLASDSRRLLSYSFQLNPPLVLLSFLIECSGLFLAVLVWHGMLACFGGRSSYRDDLRIYCYSMLAVVVPGGFWPLVSRAALYKRQGIAMTRVAAASVVEFALIGLAGLLVYGLTAALTPSENVWRQPSVGLTIATLALVLTQPPLFNRITGWLLHRSHAADEPPISLRYTDLGIWLVLEGFVVVIGGVAVYALLHGFAAVPSGLFFPVISAWAIAAATGNLFFWVPATPFIRDSAMTLILMQSLPASVIIVFVLLVRMWTIASILIVSMLAYLFLGRGLHRQRAMSLDE